MKELLMPLLLVIAGCGGSLVPIVHAGISPIKAELEAGGTINLPAGVVNMTCADEAVITKSSKIIGAGRNETILNDSCTNSTATIAVNLTNPITVQIEDLQINHVGGPDIQSSGGVSNPGAVIADYVPMLDHELRIVSVKMTGSAATACLVTDGLNLFFLERSIIVKCSNDGAQIGSFGVNMHDNWFAQNGRNGVTFVGSGFCGTCSGNEYFFNTGNGVEYAVTGASDPRHVADFADSNQGFGVVVNGVRDFSWNAGWIGNNTLGGVNIADTGSMGTSIVGTTFANDFGTDLIVTKINGPLHVKAYNAMPQYTGCNALIAQVCTDLNKM